MNSTSAQRLLDGIDQTIKDIDSIVGSNYLVDSYLAKFLVVHISGIYEQAIENIFIDFADQNTSRTELVTYVENCLDRYFRNPNFRKIIELIEAFGNTVWKDEIKNLSSEGLALNSIVNNKNSLAHGQATTITLLDVKQFYTKSRLIIETIDSFIS